MKSKNVEAPGFAQLRPSDGAERSRLPSARRPEAHACAEPSAAPVCPRSLVRYRQAFGGSGVNGVATQQACQMPMSGFPAALRSASSLVRIESCSSLSKASRSRSVSLINSIASSTSSTT